MTDSRLMYKQIENHILDQIKTKKYAKGDFLPTERELARRFRVSQYPVRQAIGNLIDRGILNKIPAKGTYVNRVPNGIIKTITNRIAVLYSYSDESFLSNQYYIPIINGINFQAQQNWKSPMLCSLSRPSDDGQAGIIRELAGEADGFMVIEPATEGFEEIEKALKQTNKPAVLLNFEAPDGQLDSVMVDNQESSRRMTELLIRNGHRRIAFVHIKSRFHDAAFNPVFKKRMAGYKEALSGHGLTADEDLVICLAGSNDTEPVRRLLSGDDPPTALFCFGDDTALTLYGIANQLALRIPDDISIVGFDGIEAGEKANPPLTTVVSPLMEIGKASVQRLLDILEKKGRPYPQKVILPGRIAERGSHKNIKSQ